MAKEETEKSAKGAKGSKAAGKSTKETPAKKASAKKAPAPKKPAKTAAAPKKAAAKPKAKPASKGAKKEPAGKPAAKPKTKPAAKAAKKAPAKKPAAKTEPVKREPAKKERPKKEAPKKKAPAKKPAKEEVPKKAPARKPAAKKPAVKKAPPKAKPKAPPRPKPEVPPKTEDGLLLFNRWDLGEVEVADPGLKRYMNLSPTYLPHTGGRWANRAFTKARVNLVERFINNMMRTEKYTGKKSKTIKVVQNAFTLVEKRAKRNPVQVLVDGLERAAPREEVTRLRFGGISVPRAVDIAPARRLDLALRNITTGAVRATFKTPKSASQCLADEILMASEGDINSFAIGKKEEMERIAASAR